MEEILSAFSEQGLNPGQIVLDGRIHRFKADKSDHKNSGWYVGFQNHTQLGGEIFQVVVFGNYKEGVTHQYQTEGRKYSAHDRKAIKEQIEKAKKSAEAQREIAWREVAEEVQKIWESLSTEGTSEYINKKRIADCRENGARFDSNGDAYIPARDIEGKIWSLQKFSWDSFKQKSNKFFHPGGRIQGCFHQIGRPGGSRIIITEGFATGASIALATGESVVCAFSSGNLKTVAKEFKRKYPETPIIICGDDDCWKDPIKNPGREKAEEAAKACLGKAVFPEFKDTSNKPTDFNDLHLLEGLDEVKKQVSVAEAPKLALYSLGFKEKEYFFTSTNNRQVVGISAFKESDLLGLMPIEYWQAMFPGKSDTAVDWTAAKSTIMEECRRRGIFQARHVRGAGVWMDEGRIIVNMGDHLIVDGKRVELGQIKSRYFYTLGERLVNLNQNTLTAKECETFVQAAQKFKWVKSESGMLLAGALVCTRVCGALPIRPHAWITGGAQTGKTTLFEHLVNKIMGENKLYFLGSTTEAGVRQSLKADALPILFDEFETNDAKTADKIASLIELMRASWAESGGVIVKGGTSGNASHFQVRFSAIVSSIRTRLTNDADKGRFAVLELAPHGSDQKHWRDLQVLLSQIDTEYADRLFSRTIRLLPTMLGNFKIIKQALAKRVDSRFGDQYGMILAGYSILLQDEPMSVEDAEWLADQIELAEERETAKVTDHDDALAHLLTTKVQFEGLSSRREALIGELISSVWKNKVLPQSVEVDALTRIGIRVDSEFVYVIACNHAEQESRVWRGTKWSQTWGNSLVRLNGAVKKSRFRVGALNKTCVAIPITHFDISK